MPNFLDSSDCVIDDDVELDAAFTDAQLVLPEHLADQNADDVFTEYGLKTPNGSIFWGTFAGKPLLTPQDRFLMVVALQRTAAELGLLEEGFVQGYSWVGRDVHQVVHRSFTEAGEVPIQSEVAIAAPAQPEQG